MLYFGETVFGKEELECFECKLAVADSAVDFLKAGKRVELYLHMGCPQLFDKITSLMLK